MTARFRAAATPGDELAAYFHREAFDGILAQPGCVGIRIYRGTKVDGSSAAILVGVAEDGEDMSSSEIYENHFPCPPYCGGGGGVGGP